MTGKTWLKNRIADIQEVVGDDQDRELTKEEKQELLELAADDT